MRLPEEFRQLTKQYASEIVRLYAQLPRSRREVEVIGHQLLRSETSVAAHTREASRARTDAEFCSKIDGALQEADESQLWIELLREECGMDGQNIERLHAKTNELVGIFVTMANKTKRQKCIASRSFQNFRISAF
jgi:four helix bundle protein